jgi:hypothetical protein
VTGVDHRGALEAVERIVNRGGEPEAVLRAVLDALHARGISYAAVRIGDEQLSVGSPDDGLTSGALTATTTDQEFVARVATLISPYSQGSSPPKVRSTLGG